MCMKETELRITLECGHTFCGRCLRIGDEVGAKRLSNGIEVNKVSDLFMRYW